MQAIYECDLSVLAAHSLPRTIICSHSLLHLSWTSHTWVQFLLSPMSDTASNQLPTIHPTITLMFYLIIWPTSSRPRSLPCGLSVETDSGARPRPLSEVCDDVYDVDVARPAWPTDSAWLVTWDDPSRGLTWLLSFSLTSRHSMFPSSKRTVLRKLGHNLLREVHTGSSVECLFCMWTCTMSPASRWDCLARSR